MTKSEYTNLVYKHKSLKITDKITAINNINQNELLLIEQLFTGQSNICMTLIRNNEHLFNNLEPKNEIWSLEKINELDEHANKKTIRNCLQIDDTNLIFGEELSKIINTKTQNTITFNHVRYSLYMNVTYICVYAKHVIKKGQTIGLVIEQNNEIVNNLHEREYDNITKILVEYENTEIFKKTAIQQKMAMEGLYESDNVMIKTPRYIKMLNEKYNGDDSKYFEKMNLLFGTLLGKTFRFYNGNDKNDIPKILICLIASHINCKERLTNFHELLNMIHFNFSQRQRIIRTNQIHISLSHEDNIDITETKKIINEYNFESACHDKTLSQFEHYDYLIKNIKVEDQENTWIIFSDDDDIWNEHRLATYCSIIKQFNDPQAIYVKTDEYELDKNKIIKGKDDNYVNYCIRHKYVKLFFDSVNINILQHRFCDVFMRSFISTYGDDKLKHAKVDTSEILYVWRHVDYPRSCEVTTNLEQKKVKEIKEMFYHNLDAFMAHTGWKFGNNRKKKFIDFCEKLHEESHERLDNGNGIVIRRIGKLYDENIKNNIFNIEMPRYMK